MNLYKICGDGNICSTLEMHAADREALVLRASLKLFSLITTLTSLKIFRVRSKKDAEQQISEQFANLAVAQSAIIDAFWTVQGVLSTTGLLGCKVGGWGGGALARGWAAGEPRNKLGFFCAASVTVTSGSCRTISHTGLEQHAGPQTLFLWSKFIFFP